MPSEELWPSASIQSTGVERNTDHVATGAEAAHSDIEHRATTSPRRCPASPGPIHRRQ